MYTEEYLVMDSNNTNMNQQQQNSDNSYISNSNYNRIDSSSAASKHATKHNNTIIINNNANQQLYDLLQSDTIINYSNLSTQKKRLQFSNDLSFFSKDCTQDYTNQQGYNQLVNKIHFQRSRNRQLINQLARQKENIITKYLHQIMEQFKELSDENKRLRTVYKKQAGGGFKVQKITSKTMVRNNSAKNNDQMVKNQPQLLSTGNMISNNGVTPRNSTTRITSRKSVTTLSNVGGGKSNIINNNNGNIVINGNNNIKGNNNNRVFFGVGGGNFYQTQKLDTLRPTVMMDDKTVKMMHNCESSINIMHNNTTGNNHTIQQQQNNNNGSSTIIHPSPRITHKRRQSQLTQRKDYPLNNNNNSKDYNDDFLMMCDYQQREMSFYGNDDEQGRYSIQPNRKRMMMKNKNNKVSNNNNNENLQCFNNNNNYGNSTKRILNESVQRASFKLSLNQQSQNQAQQSYQPTTTKNIFIEFLQTLLLQQHITSNQLTQTIQHQTTQQQLNMIIPSYHNIKLIQQLQKEISNKNVKLRQLQQVVNVFKEEIQEIVGTDVKMVNQLMIELLQVKGRYMEMQQKVDSIGVLKGEIEQKQRVKQGILAKIKKQQLNKQKQTNHQNYLNKENNNKTTSQQQQPAFPIPQSIFTLFQLLNINIPKNSKPAEYLSQIKKFPKNTDLFQAFDSKKRNQSNMKIKEVIDQIKQGRKKFNQVIKIYQARIVKLQQKINKYQHHPQKK